MTMQLDDVKREVAVANRVLPDIGLASGVLGSLGHVSMRVPDDPEKFVVKGRGYRHRCACAGGAGGDGGV